MRYLCSFRRRALQSPCKPTETVVPSLAFGPTISVPYDTVHDAFRAQAEAHPSQTAVVDFTGHSVSYGELDRLSVQLSVRLRAEGVGSGARVCLLIERSIAQTVAIMAVLRAGATSESSYAGSLSASLASFDNAYIIYTSGTTGRPKGVIVSHFNVCNLLCLSPGNLGIRPGTRVAQLLNVAFDMCAWEILGCLMNGNTLHLRGPHRQDWIKILKTVDVVISTPSILAQHGPADYPNIRIVAMAGEPCPQELADRGALNTIGSPTPNNSVYVLDSDLRPVPRGEAGIMWAGGNGVCKGYLNLPDLTSGKFVRDPFAPQGGVMYNTGDIGRLWDDGQLDHLGRVDDQVKIKGFRVELDGVSAAIHACPDVTTACALLVEQDLWAFYAPEHVSASQISCVVVDTTYLSLVKVQS
ncbi:predicted protein [Postia placenta Mad-698-R]|uniref:AMP-dependent synthetase/ligase domain-containing protein n=1 Tax=Postia placenta MAD-698-R-SB12 TaxID=670580 RepID=A0A1X6MQM3_9APHY|nr:hypothetical protein POSPLADRAFT_1049341 [Postia placenta MAD-698-R-SB12]EED79822.1 predicted protein [Postia placenta Mad-698-R]OSX58579.1 hypothetical protein POSPLADRAFT_1049341 [Postia placenta MAD-698-R-SB12]